ncbi:MAG: uroporphyrinogen-III synthase [Gammaproteobacteria bacterium]|nr:uroporphyrinogen-III synthase [Gammaproteobacteria bacterium]
MTASPRRPLAGLKIVVTRPVEQAQSLCDALIAEGAEALKLPLLQIKSQPCDADRLAAALRRAAIAIFVSANAVKELVTQLPRFNTLTPLPAIAAVGSATATAWEAVSGRRIDLLPDAGADSEALLALPALQQVAGKNLLILRGVGGRELLATTLRQRGAEVTIVELYHRAPPELPLPEINWHTVDIITTTSNTILDNLVALTRSDDLALLKKIPLLVVSQRAAVLAAQYHFQHPAIIAPGADNPSIITTLNHWRAENR